MGSDVVSYGLLSAALCVVAGAPAATTLLFIACDVLCFACLFLGAMVAGHMKFVWFVAATGFLGLAVVQLFQMLRSAERDGLEVLDQLGTLSVLVFGGWVVRLFLWLGGVDGTGQMSLTADVGTGLVVDAVSKIGFGIVVIVS